MGFETRRVPPNWEHPISEEYDDGRYQPIYDRYYLDAINEWIENHKLWLEGKHKYQISPAASEFCKNCKYYAEYDGNPPDINYYNHYYKPEEATWYQLYENVSEGTPVSPPFETEDELINYLVEFGDFWYQKYNKESSLPTKEQATKLVKNGSVSFVMSNGKIHDAYSQQDLKN